jgi:hypothetical protein
MRWCKFRWIGHTLQKSDQEPCKAALMWNPQGSRKRGRPRNSWQRSTLTEAGKRSWKELRSIARDRTKWKELVDNLCSWWNNGLYYYYYMIVLWNMYEFYTQNFITQIYGGYQEHHILNGRWTKNLSSASVPNFFCYCCYNQSSKPPDLQKASP